MAREKGSSCSQDKQPKWPEQMEGIDINGASQKDSKDKFNEKLHLSFMENNLIDYSPTD